MRQWGWFAHAWKQTNKQTNKPVELTLKEGGTTKVRNLKDIDSKRQLKIN
jgi:hypothetical protein